MAILKLYSQKQSMPGSIADPDSDPDLRRDRSVDAINEDL